LEQKEESREKQMVTEGNTEKPLSISNRSRWFYLQESRKKDWW